MIFLSSNRVFLSFGEEIEIEEWSERILEYLKEKESATFQEIAKKFELQGDAKDVLSNILWIMGSEEKISSEPLSIPLAGGLILTKIYKLSKK